MANQLIYNLILRKRAAVTERDFARLIDESTASNDLLLFGGIVGGLLASIALGKVIGSIIRKLRAEREQQYPTDRPYRPYRPHSPYRPYKPRKRYK